MTHPSAHSDSVNSASAEPSRVWYELSVEVDAEAVEAVSELFGRFGYNEGVAIDEPYVQEEDGDNLEIVTDRPYLIRTYVADSDYSDEKIEQLKHGLHQLGRMRTVGALAVSPLKEEDWANAWKDHFQVHHIGDRVVIRPPWHTYEPGDGEVVVELDPGMAFGTGLHPSTRLSVLGVEEVVQTGDCILDVGTGSGILAIAAIKLGAVHADTVDVETVAVEATADNSRRNDVAERVRVEHGSAGKGEPFSDQYGTYDVVFANIIARILVEIAEGVVAAAKPDGYLVLAGIIESREQDVTDVYSRLGADVVTRRQAEDWISLVLRKRSGT